MTNIIEKLGKAALDAPDTQGGTARELVAMAMKLAEELTGKPVDFDIDSLGTHMARAVLQTLHDNITPEMIAGAESAAWDHGNHMPMPRYAECAIKGALATALKGERA